MKRAIWALALAAMIGSMAHADEADLRDGVFIAHYVADITYSVDEPAGGWCGEYTPYAISAAGEQVNRIDVGGDYMGVIWYVIAAWAEDKSWCGTEFGLGVYDAGDFAATMHGACYTTPGAGLEIAHPDWPAAETGIVLTTTGEPWSGNYLPVYYFAGYAYSTSGGGQIPLGVNTNYENPSNYSAGFANCASPPEPFEADCLGVLGIDTDGVACSPGTPDPVAVCCVGSACSIITALDCDGLGGDWYEELNSCSPNPCDPQYACCDNLNQCTLQTQSQCQIAGGDWLEGVESCEPNPCLGDAVCCYGNENATCVINSASECQTLSGVWHSGWDSCDPNPCGPTAACCSATFECTMQTVEVCDDLGGVWMSEEDCSPNPCGPDYACCVDNVCTDMTVGECTAAGGEWVEGYLCAVVTCEDARACCLSTTECALYPSEAECLAAGGDWYESWTTCVGADCSIAVNQSSWGKIKALYK